MCPNRWKIKRESQGAILRKVDFIWGFHEFSMESMGLISDGGKPVLWNGRGEYGVNHITQPGQPHRGGQSCQQRERIWGSCWAGVSPSSNTHALHTSSREENPYTAGGTSCQQRELSIGGSTRKGLGSDSNAHAYTHDSLRALASFYQRRYLERASPPDGVSLLDHYFVLY